MDVIQSLLLNAFQYELTQVVFNYNNKAPTWWPKIIRQYNSKEWATSPDPDSYPVDGVSNPVKLGDKDIYDWVMDNILCKLLTTYEKTLIALFLGKGYVESPYKVSKILKKDPNLIKKDYEKTLLKIKQSLDPHEIYIYFQKI